MMWIKLRRKPVPPPTVPVAPKTADELADELAARKAYWDEVNPLRRYRVVFDDGAEHVVVAHYSSIHGDRVNFMRKVYGSYTYGGRNTTEVVFSAKDSLVRFVELLD